MEDSRDWMSESSRSSSDDQHLRLPRTPDNMNGRLPRLKDLNPLRMLHSNISYQMLPSSESRSVSPMSLRTMAQRWSEKGGSSVTSPSPSNINPFENRRRCGLPRMSPSKALTFTVTGLILLALLVSGGVRHYRQHGPPGDAPAVLPPAPSAPYPWESFHRLNGFYNGIRTLVSASEHTPDNRWATEQPPPMLAQTGNYEKKKMPPMEPETYNPYPDFSSSEYLAQHHPVHACYLDEAETIAAPDIYAYPGVPQHMTDPFYGSHETLGLNDNVCFDRFGRLGPYGYGYSVSQGGLGIGESTERTGSEAVYAKSGYVNYENVDWGMAQKRCYEKNKARFETNSTSGLKPIKRHAYILRTWTGYKYDDHQMLSLRAMINELSLKSGGEYDVHFLVHVKDNSIPIWADAGVYRKTLEDNVPREFWNISTLWSEQQMTMYYPEPFEGNFYNDAGSSIHGVYRSAHFALQWFSQQHQEYDFFWNWEMDMRLTGHYWEFNNAIGEWGRKQPRKGLWERSSRFYMPQLHGTWENFTEQVAFETQAPEDHVWGPVQDFERDIEDILTPPAANYPPHSYEADNYSWGVGEDADLLVFNPIFDPATTNWVFREDVTGWNNSRAVPPRRAAIITVARLSRGLLATMHEETFRLKHTMFPEMWPPSMALHHGYKAAYVPHPVYFDRDWDLEHMDQALNRPPTREDSPFGFGEHNLLGSSFYYNAGFSAALWRRWLGQWENGEGGRAQEESGTGRMCLRSTLFHPIKHENGPLD